ncbi:rod shape-determining protein MreD [Sphingomonas crusticola]|uniref:rod shape-determining protein MreD n=1 Tax=Sphingomonas crusticola TaxID=1697973 RepID=UPI000E266240|nr:rod shape-determining protein MreD [Sphingomonas crusticola]
MTILESDLLGRPSAFRLQGLPIASTLIASCIGLLPFVASAPVIPPFGLLMALGWRLLRPELWPAWTALPLGLADDLIVGAPPGTAMTLWTITFLGIDLVDSRPMWRDHWLDWWIAALAISWCALGTWATGRFVSGGGAFWPMIPPTLIAILAFPPIARLCATLDRWRLRT